MNTVNVLPMPAGMRTVPPRLRHGPPPIFPDCGPAGPTEEDLELARELFAILDEASKSWYGRRGIFEGL